VSVAVAGVAAIRVFWQRRGGEIDPDVHEAGVTMWLPPLALATMGIVFGPLPHLVDPLIGVAAEAMRPVLAYEGLSFTLDDGAVLSALAVAVGFGALIFIAWDRLHAVMARVAWLDRVGPGAWYSYGLAAIPALAALATRRLQHGGLVGYSAALVVFVAASLVFAMTTAGIGLPAFEMPSLAIGGAALLLAAAAVAVCVVRDSFVLLLVSGLIGFGSALLFLFLGAPDLAFTQFAVEVAFVVVIASLLLRVNQLDLTQPPVQRAWPRAVLAVGTGVLVAGLLLAATIDPLDLALPQFFAERSVPQAHGRNVVNVILVDFRAVDTLGEIAVVAISFIAAMPLLKLAHERLRRPSGNAA
jgi:multicomponent Na+:H+ antiporter subunit A